MSVFDDIKNKLQTSSQCHRRENCQSQSFDAKDRKREEWTKRAKSGSPFAINILPTRDCDAKMERPNSVPSLPSYRDASPVLASLAKAQKLGSSNSSLTDQDLLMTSLSKAMKRRSPCKQDEFWEALQSHYNYLMDEELIKSCKEANGELSQDDDVGPSPIWTFNEYTERYKELCEWLDKIHHLVLMANTNSSFAAETAKEHAEDLQKRNKDLKLFKDQSQRLIHRYPNLTEEIALQVTHINTLWDELEKTIIVPNPKIDTEMLLKDIAIEMRCLRKWLREMEVKLRPPALFPGCTLEDLERKYKEHETYQKDIESRGKNVLSLLKLCEQLQSCQEGSIAIAARDAGHVHRVALNLERRWHATWLRSLECHCVLEELIKKFKAGILPEDLPSLNVNDEPLRKYPRLSGEWTGNANAQHDCSFNDCTSCERDSWHDNDNERLSLDDMDEEFCTALEDNLNISQESRTRDVGSGNDALQMLTNDKGVMVGTTGITELKASHEGSCEPYEIIQDVGYSSESSTHLSNEERGGENIQIYSFPEEKREDSTNRSGPNFGYYFFKHVDTDSECKMEESENDIAYLKHSTPLKNDRESDFNGMDIDGIDWSEDDYVANQMTDSDKLREMQNGNDKNDKDTIHALVEQAERLVRKESLSDLMGKQKNLEPLKLGEAQMKANRLKEWLRKQHVVHEFPAALPPATVLDSSCDASGECTSNDSEDEHSDSSEEQNSSVIMCQMRNSSFDGTIGSPETSENSPVKVTMRNKKRTNGTRPWSVTELYQLSNRLDLSQFSVSESALNALISPNGNENCNGSNAKELTSPSIESVNSSRKNKAGKMRRKYFRRSDSGSDNHSQSHGSLVQDGQIVQKSPSRRKYSRGSKSHSSSSGGGKSAGHSSGTEQYSSEAAYKGTKEGGEMQSESESEPTMVEKIHKVERQQTEELSSLSEQAWDDYQEAPYLSEAYSEKQVDEDLIKKLMNFGDDYSAFIESQSDSISVGSYRGLRRRVGSGMGRGGARNQAPVRASGSTDVESDSDLDDLHHIIKDSSNQLQMLESKLKKKTCKCRQSNSLNLATDHIELFATCQTNINCLQVIAGHLRAKRHGTSVSEADVEQIKDTIQCWEKLRAQMQELQSDEKLTEVQQEMNELKECMNNIDNSISGCSNKIDNKEILEKMIQEFQAYLSTLREKKASLLTINVQVHSFVPRAPESCLNKLKEEVAALYHRWDEVFDRGQSQLTALHTLKSTWLQYENDLDELRSELREDQASLRAPDPACRSDPSTARSPQSEESGTKEVPAITLTVPSEAPPRSNGCSDEKVPNPELLSRRQLQMSEVEGLARQLEGMLGDGEAWQSISRALDETTAELQTLRRKGRRKSSFLLPNSPRSDVPKRVRFSIAPEMDKPESPSRKKIGKNRSFLWRVIRAAVPIQLTIVVLLCMAYLLGPDCCDARNNFVFSFSPHLRYVNGPPPV